MTNVALLAIGALLGWGLTMLTRYFDQRHTDRTRFLDRKLDAAESLVVEATALRVKASVWAGRFSRNQETKQDLAKISSRLREMRGTADAQTLSETEQAVKKLDLDVERFTKEIDQAAEEIVARHLSISGPRLRTNILCDKETSNVADELSAVIFGRLIPAAVSRDPNGVDSAVTKINELVNDLGAKMRKELRVDLPPWWKRLWAWAMNDSR